jgi:L-amino acid N-acyltransferase YncA
MKQQKSIQIRYATRDDISDITTIYAREVIEGTATFELDPPTEQEMLERFYALWNAQYPTYVATIDNKVVGYAYANMFRPRPAYRFTVEDSIYIAPNWQRYGVGSKLMQELIKACEEKGFRQMIAVIGDSASIGSVQLHTRMGFKHVGTLEHTGYKLDQWRDTILMQRALGRGGLEEPKT